MRNFSMSVVAVALCAIAAATTVSAQDDPTNPPSWAGHKKAFIPEEYEWRNDTTLWFKGWFGNRPQWRFSNASLKADGWSAAVNVTTGLIRDGGWHREEYHVNQTLVHGNEEEGQLAYYALGYADGYSIGQRLWNLYRSDCQISYNALHHKARHLQTKEEQWMASFFTGQFKFIKEYAQKGETHYARHIKRQLAMMEGRAAGFNKRVADGLAGTMPRIENGPIETFTQYKMFFFGSVIDRLDLPSFAPFGLSGEPWTNYSLWWPSASPFVHNRTGPAPTEATLKRRNRGHCTCYAKLTHDDLFMGRATENDYANMNNSITTITVESQVTMVRTIDGLASMEDIYLTSNKMYLCSISNVIPDPRFLAALSNQSITMAFPSLYVAIFTKTAEQFKDIVSVHNGIQSTTWFAIDLKRFAPATKTSNATLLPGAAVAIDAYPGNMLLSEDITANLTRGQTIVSNNRPVTLASQTYFPSPCQWCHLMGLSMSPTPVELPILTQSVRSLEEFFRLSRYNEWKTDGFSITQPPFTPRQAFPGLAIGVRYDLNPDIKNYTWGMAQCMPGETGIVDGSAISWKRWLGDLDGVDAPVASYPIYAILSPPYENKDTPVYRPKKRLLSQADEYHFAPVNFTLSVPEAFRMPPMNIYGGDTIASSGNGGKQASAAVAIIASCGVVFVIAYFVVTVRRNRVDAVSRAAAAREETEGRLLESTPLTG